MDRPSTWPWLVYVWLVFLAASGLVPLLQETPGSRGGADLSPNTWRGFSGHWMAFYSAALTILYAAQNAASQGTQPHH